MEDEKERKLKERLKANYESYIQKLRQKPAEELIGMAEEIAAVKFVYEELRTEGAFGEYADYLLQFENPLELLQDNWLSYESCNRCEEIDHMLWDMKDRVIGIGDNPLAGQSGENTQGQGVVMC